jgi:hypothetical protein
MRLEDLDQAERSGKRYITITITIIIIIILQGLGQRPVPVQNF